MIGDRLTEGLSQKLIPNNFPSASRMKYLIPWNRQVSPAQRRVQDTQRGKASSLYRLDMQRANCSSGMKVTPLSCPGA